MDASSREAHDERRRGFLGHMSVISGAAARVVVTLQLNVRGRQQPL